MLNLTGSWCNVPNKIMVVIIFLKNRGKVGAIMINVRGDSTIYPIYFQKFNSLLSPGFISFAALL